VDRRRAGGAGVLDAGRRLEAERRIGLEHQRGRELLLDEAAVHRAEKYLVDIGRRDPGIGQCALRDLDDQRFNVAPVMLAEFRMRPPDDAPGHEVFPSARASATRRSRSIGSYRVPLRPNPHPAWDRPIGSSGSGPATRQPGIAANARHRDCRTARPGDRSAYN
jgi:hypothetical protein